MFRFGIEHEVGFLDRDGQFVDFISTTFTDLPVIIEQLHGMQAMKSTYVLEMQVFG